MRAPSAEIQHFGGPRCIHERDVRGQVCGLCRRYARKHGYPMDVRRMTASTVQAALA